MDAAQLYTIRPYVKEDLNFIQNSWGASYYKGADYIDYLSPKEFHEKHRPIREEILNRPNIALLVACDRDDQDLILGWVLVEKPKHKGTILHYIYLKEAFKGEGISDELLHRATAETPVYVSHMTDRARKIIRKKKSYFKDYQYLKEPIMVRDSYLNALPKGDK